jgi:hypothetical protein
LGKWRRKKRKKYWKINCDFLMLTYGTCCDSSFYLYTLSSFHPRQHTLFIFFPSLSTYLVRLLVPARCSSSMFSLLSSTFVVSRVGILRSTSLYWPTTWRFFSQGHTRYAEPEDPVARRKRLDKKNEAQRRKYRDDAVFREHEITRAMLRLNSPLTREQNKRSMRLRNENWRNLNPTAYAEGIERINAHNIQRRASDPRFKFSGMLHNFLMHHAWAGDELPWKTHVPTVYPEKVTRQCARCDRRPPGGGAKLWYVGQICDVTS